MRNGQNNNNKRMRGRNNNNNNNNNHNNNRRAQNPMTRVFESNGPDVKIRGTASHIAEKYVQLARDAQASGDPVAAENYYQHAEHYFRLIAAAQEQFRQNQPQQFRNDSDVREETSDDSESDGYSPFGAEPGFVPRDIPREQPRDLQRDQQPYREQQHQPREHRPNPPQAQQPTTSAPNGNNERLPSFNTGSQPQPVAAGLPFEGGQPNGGQNPGGGERYSHRRRRRPHGPRPEGQLAQPALNDDTAE
jgi:hypothetical protein